MKPKAKVCKEELKKYPLIFFFLGFTKDLICYQMFTVSYEQNAWYEI